MSFLACSVYMTTGCPQPGASSDVQSENHDLLNILIDIS